MATIVIIVHQHDKFLRDRRFFRPRSSGYLLFDIAAELTRRGHRIVTQTGVADATPGGDAAILHVDLTVTPDEYVEYARQFPRCMNVAVTDISKKSISGAVLMEGDPWVGPVIVKSDLNCRGAGEVRNNLVASAKGLPSRYPASLRFDYVIYESVDSVPESLRSDESIVVEKFLPERPSEGEYAARFWTFCGSEERCTRWISRDPIVKGESALHNEACAVPDELRDMRARLGVDYGKFDFVMTDDGPVVFDVNKTLGRPQRLANVLRPEAIRFASGFEAWMGQG